MSAHQIIDTLIMVRSESRMSAEQHNIIIIVYISRARGQQAKLLTLSWLGQKVYTQMRKEANSDIYELFRTCTC